MTPNFPWFLRPLTILQRNILVWRKLFFASILGSFGEPLLYLLALGYGLGRFVGEMSGMPYMVFLASGIVCSSAMNTASFEGMYSAYIRMQIQQTWTAMLTTPLSVGDVLFGELLWTGLKSVMSAVAIILVATGLGLFHSWHVLLSIPVIFLTGSVFGAMALVMTSLARGYDFFMYYQTLLLMPMMLLSGVFFPMDGLPHVLQTLVCCLPLYHAVAIIRPLLTAMPVHGVGLHLLVITFYGVAAFAIARSLVARRLFS